jgi:hypothetical protein
MAPSKISKLALVLLRYKDLNALGFASHPAKPEDPSDSNLLLEISVELSKFTTFSRYQSM